MDAVDVGGLGGTYAGNPLACAAALAVFDIFENEHILERSKALGLVLRARLDAIAARYPRAIRGVRGLGAMLALEFVKAGPGDSGPSLAQRISAAAFEHGVITLTAGPKASVLRFLVPLVASEEDITRGFEALERGCERVLE
jgi:4-aminobutyrate aminotransferase/(S)-3-amino-2-methylpropionate transaminase